jgi:maltose O-acetyltransferase
MRAVPADAGGHAGARVRKAARYAVGVAAEELASFHPAIAVRTLPARAVPRFAVSRLRTPLLRAAGWQIGPHTLVFAVPCFYGGGPIQSRLTVGESVIINAGCTFDLNAAITIGDRVAVGHEVLILTSSHEVGPSTWRAGSVFTAPVHIADGAWVGARSVILPGVTIGRGAIVAAGSVVTKDVPEDALAGGVPAVVRRSEIVS